MREIESLASEPSSGSLVRPAWVSGSVLTVELELAAQALTLAPAGRFLFEERGLAHVREGIARVRGGLRVLVARALDLGEVRRASLRREALTCAAASAS